jgi:S-DNA-T family DNA segregation ATPase FtsK/SpoIIIE
MPDSTTQHVLDVRAALSHALGAAVTALRAAEDARDDATARLRRVIAAAVARREKVTAARDERLRQIEERHRHDRSE